jgi:hypothetical protein
MNASSLASAVLVFLLSSFSGDVQVVAFAPNINVHVGRSSKQIRVPVSSHPRLRFAPNKLDSSPTLLVRRSSSSSSRVSNSSVPSVVADADADSVLPRWKLWKRLRNRIATATSVSAAAAAVTASGSSASSSSAGSTAVSRRSAGSRWMKAAAAFATFLVLRPISAIASGGGMGAGARTTPLPKLEGYVLYCTICVVIPTAMYCVVYCSCLSPYANCWN